MYRGDNWRSAEFGHMVIHPGGRTCYCGKKGCLDAYCSALRLADLVQLAKGGLLDLHILEGSLNDQVAVSAQILLQTGGDGSHAAVNFSLVQLALGNELGITGSDLVLAAIGPLLLDVAQSDGEASTCANAFAMPWPIVPAPITPTFIVSTSKLCCCGAVGVGARIRPRGVGDAAPYKIVVEFSYS